MCGIVGILLADETSHANQLIFDALTALQHRGQDAAGITTCSNGRFFARKDNGLVKDVFQAKDMLLLTGPVGIGHCRYPTAGTSSCTEAQPLYTNYPFGISLAHNGNLTNVEELRRAVMSEGRHCNTDSDSELLLNVFAEELGRARGRALGPEDIFHAVTHVLRRCVGGYAVVAMVNGHGLVAFRDRWGIRPLCFGTRASPGDGGGTDYTVASESVVMDMVGFDLVRDVAPGECIFIPLAAGAAAATAACGTAALRAAAAPRHLYTRQCSDAAVLSPCLFEYVYFARPDSILDGAPVYEARLEMGVALAQRILATRDAAEIDVVIPIPDTARTSAVQCAYALNRPYREGFIKNRYIARTFIMPGQAARKKTVRLKLNTIRSEFRGKNVLLVDDSIVRGTTSMELVQMARDAGARKVFFSSAAPPVRHPNVYGIDIPTKTELVAHGRTEEEIAQWLGADWVCYQDLAELEQAVRRANPRLQGFDSSCFSGLYVTGDITEAYLSELHAARNDLALARKRADSVAAVSISSHTRCDDDGVNGGIVTTTADSGSEGGTSP
ncbi:Amidophosphoribosyltransferase [Tribonema minus]|uniref:Amidophosphoribosyltransferase n=1 Tax=Tribonema minus TaxID=303371 RepID=A0A835Z8Y5_9STRA|nr:Amidophosphoribosyltransferase [Tribonema minus]